MYIDARNSVALALRLAPRMNQRIRRRLAGDDAIGCVQPGGYGGLERLASSSGKGVDLPLTALDDLTVRGQIAARLELVQHRIDRSLGGTAASVRGPFDGLDD